MGQRGKRRRFGLIIDHEQDIVRIVAASLTYFQTLSVILNAANPELAKGSRNEGSHGFNSKI
jgi:hypothetical protein